MTLVSDNEHISNDNEEIAEQSYPIDNDCSSSTLIETTTKRKQQEIDCTTILQETYLPKDTDVIIGNGGRVRKHPGNIEFKNIIDSKLKDYASFSLRREKTNMIRSIVNQIHENGGIFVRKDPATGTWFEVDDVSAREKISQAFRNSIYRKCNRLHDSIFCSSFSSSSPTIKGNSLTTKKRAKTISILKDTNININTKEEMRSSLSFAIRSESMTKKTLSPTIRLSSNDIGKKGINYSRNNNHKLEKIHHHGLKATQERNGCSLVSAFDNLISSLPLSSIGDDDPYEPFSIFC